MNFTQVPCSKCGKLAIVSYDELMIFEAAVCQDCDNQTAKFIRHKIVYGFYDMPEIDKQIAEAILEKELKNVRKNLREDVPACDGGDNDLGHN